MYSFQPWDRDPNNPQVYEIAKQWSDRNLYAAVAREAVYKPAEAFQSWQSNGAPGDPPVGEFGDSEYLRIGQQELTIEANDRGYGAELKLILSGAEWFHLDTAEYQEEWLARVCDDDDPTRHGSAEVYLHDGAPALHLTVAPEIEVIVPDGVERWLGVDLGDNTLYAAACVGASSGEIECVELESGREYRHYREQLKEKRAELSRKGDLRGVKACKGDIERYTDWVLHTASKEIVDLALEHDACGIRLEDLTGYRETADDPIHD